MAFRFARRASNVAGSATLEVLRAAASMRERGIDVVDLGPGEPDFHTPEYIKEAAIGAIRANFTKYTAFAPRRKWRSAVLIRATPMAPYAEYVLRENKLGFCCSYILSYRKFTTPLS